MLTVFKLVSCKTKTGASRELALRPRGPEAPRPEKLKLLKISLWLCNCTYIYGNGSINI